MRMEKAVPLHLGGYTQNDRPLPSTLCLWSVPSPFPTIGTGQHSYIPAHCCLENQNTFLSYNAFFFIIITTHSFSAGSQIPLALISENILTCCKPLLL